MIRFWLATLMKETSRPLDHGIDPHLRPAFLECQLAAGTLRRSGALGWAQTRKLLESPNIGRCCRSEPTDVLRKSPGFVLTSRLGSGDPARRQVDGKRPSRRCAPVGAPEVCQITTRKRPSHLRIPAQMGGDSAARITPRPTATSTAAAQGHLCLSPPAPPPITQSHSRSPSRLVPLECTPKVRHEVKGPNTLNGERYGFGPTSLQPRPEGCCDARDRHWADGR